MTKEDYEEAYGKAPNIDLSKIKNSVKDNVGSELAKSIGSIAKKQKKSKFCFTEESQIPLPTKGYLYSDEDDPELKSGLISIRPMTLADEEILSNQSYIKNNSTIRRLLDSCITSNFDAKNLNPHDAWFLMYSLREITYGEDYTFEVVCPKCGKKHTIELDISEVTWDTLEEKVNTVEEIKLPQSKYTVKLRCSTLGDLEEVHKLGLRYSDYGEAVLDYTARTIEILDEHGDPVNPDDYPDFYSEIPGRDRAALSKLFDKLDLKVPTFKAECKCGYEWEESIPMEQDFFRF